MENNCVHPPTPQPTYTKSQHPQPLSEILQKLLKHPPSAAPPAALCNIFHRKTYNILLLIR